MGIEPIAIALDSEDISTPTLHHGCFTVRWDVQVRQEHSVGAGLLCSLRCTLGHGDFAPLIPHEMTDPEQVRVLGDVIRERGHVPPVLLFSDCIDNNAISLLAKEPLTFSCQSSRCRLTAREIPTNLIPRVESVITALRDIVIADGHHRIAAISSAHANNDSFIIPAMIATGCDLVCSIVNATKMNQTASNTLDILIVKNDLLPPRSTWFHLRLDELPWNALLPRQDSDLKTFT